MCISQTSHTSSILISLLSQNAIHCFTHFCHNNSSLQPVVIPGHKPPPATMQWVAHTSDFLNLTSKANSSGQICRLINFTDGHCNGNKECWMWAGRCFHSLHYIGIGAIFLCPVWGIWQLNREGKPGCSRERLNNRGLVPLQTLSFILLTFPLHNINKVLCGEKDLLS